MSFADKVYFTPLMLFVLYFVFHFQYFVFTREVAVTLAPAFKSLSSWPNLFALFSSKVLYFVFIFEFVFLLLLYYVFTREIAALSSHYLSGQIYLLSLAQRFTVGSTICHRHHIPGYIQHNDRMDISWSIIFISQWDMAFISTVQHNKGSTPVKVYLPK